MVRPTFLFCPPPPPNRHKHPFFPLPPHPAFSTPPLFPGGSLGMLFGEDVHKPILGLLIEQNGDRTYSLRPLDTPQLRLKTNRDLIELVLTTIDKFQREKPEKAKESGL